MRLWLWVICALVFAMVIVGGATRLTDSGLSITEWQPLLGAIPPLNDSQWQAEFEKYRQIPQYDQINRGMSLAEFQFIYWWEWAHRFLGRFIGVVFVVPLIWLWRSGRIERGMKPRLLFLLALGALQGAIGWWMVKSGLVDRVDVSQYRLTLHLTLAAIIFAYALWLAGSLAPGRAESAALPLRLLAPVLVFCVFVQIFLGGLVAGLDAGLAFNDWPLMDGALVPDQLLILKPVWRNWFENLKTVQYTHRLIAYMIVLLAALQYLLARQTGGSPSLRRRSGLVFVFVAAQAIIGIVTLVLQVPLYWALAHQAGALLVLGSTVIHWRALSGSSAPRQVRDPA